MLNIAVPTPLSNVKRYIELLTLAFSNRRQLPEISVVYADSKKLPRPITPSSSLLLVVHQSTNCTNTKVRITVVLQKNSCCQ